MARQNCLFPRLILFFLLTAGPVALLPDADVRAGGPPAASLPETREPEILKADLDKCIDIALDNNRRRPASRFAVEMAEARHRQALAAYWPQIGFTGGYQVRDDAPNFIYPSKAIDIPMGGSLPVTIPGVGTVPMSAIVVPEQDVKLMDKEVFKASVSGTWLLYDGGMRKGARGQAEGYVALMKEESRRTDLAIIDSVKRLYFGSVLAERLHRLGRDTLERMQATLDLTEMMYKESSGRVKKTDWLENKMMVESIRSAVALLRKNELTARAALANTMGMAWNAGVIPSERDIPFTPYKGELAGLVSGAYRFNPDLGRIEAALQAAEGAVLSAKSGYYPKIALTGELSRWWNSYDGGLATDDNLKGWNVGIGVELPLFNGFLTRNKLAEARAKLSKIKEEQLLLTDGIGLQIRDTFLGLEAAETSRRETRSAMLTAVENRDLNIRAYQHELVDTEKVIRAQLMESLMSARHYKAGYDHAALRSRLEKVVGTGILKALEEI